MSKARSPRILVAEDDARWIGELSALQGEFKIVRDLATALAMIDRRRRWSGAIFDRYLLEGDRSFSIKALRQEAGFVLATEFLRKFPNGKVCVVSGDPDLSTAPPIFSRLVASDSFKYVYKGRSGSAKIAHRFVVHGVTRKVGLDGILDSLVLEPNIFGLGINLRQLIENFRAAIRSTEGQP